MVSSDRDEHEGSEVMSESSAEDEDPDVKEREELEESDWAEDDHENNEDKMAGGLAK